MAFTDLLKGEMGKGVAIGFATAMLAPLILPVLTGAARPLARAAIKTGLALYEKGRETLAEVEETLDDLVAEVRAELEQEQQLRQAAAGHTADPSGETSNPSP